VDRARSDEWLDSCESHDCSEGIRCELRNARPRSLRALFSRRARTFRLVSPEPMRRLSSRPSVLYPSSLLSSLPSQQTIFSLSNIRTSVCLDGLVNFTVASSKMKVHTLSQKR